MQRNLFHFQGLFNDRGSRYLKITDAKLRMEDVVFKGGLLWMMGVPVIVIIVLLVMGVI